MAQVFINPQLSFLAFGLGNTGSYGEGVPSTLPIASEDDIKFQVAIEFDSEAETENFINLGDSAANLYLVKESGQIVSALQFLQQQLVDYGTAYNQFPSVIRVGKMKVIVYWDQPLTDLNQILGTRDCFRILLRIFNITTDKNDNYVSQVFRRINPQYRRTSVIEYSCEENAYDFVYCNVYTPNKVRLPIYISRPQLQDEESIYVKSDGSRKLIKSVTKKEFEGFTELLTMEWHERIKAALSHDSVHIWSDRYTGGIIKSGNYDIDWPDFMDYTCGYGSFKVLATPYNWRNTNCNECKPWDCSAEVEITDLTAEDGPPNTTYTLYAVDFNVTGAYDHVILEYSLDDGQSWQEVTKEPTPQGGPYDQYYNIGDAEDGGQAHLLRITPVCDNGETGTPAIQTYPF